MEVYARDHAADEMFGEFGNYTITNYKAELANGEIDLEKLVAAMIDEGWLWEDAKPDDFRVEEKETKYVIYDECEAVFEVRKQEDTL